MTMSDAPTDLVLTELPEDERRSHRRYSLRAPGLVADMSGVYDCVVADISVGGAMLEGTLPIEGGAEVALGFDTLVGVVGVVVHRGEGFVGVRFGEDAGQRARIQAWIARRLKAARRQENWA